MDRSCRPSHQRNVVPTLPVRDRHTTCAGCFVLPVRLAFLLAGALMAGCSGSDPERYEVSGISRRRFCTRSVGAENRVIVTSETEVACDFSPSTRHLECVDM